jgi:hypothetical protein
MISMQEEPLGSICHRFRSKRRQRQNPYAIASHDATQGNVILHLIPEPILVPAWDLAATGRARGDPDRSQRSGHERRIR